MNTPIPYRYVGDLDPPITEQITTGGVAVDLTGKSVRVKARFVNQTALEIDANAAITNAVQGRVSYSPVAGDVDTAGLLLLWWEVTTGSRVQAVSESLIEIRAHAPGANAYIELEQFKRTANLDGTSFADVDAQVAILAASRAIDEHCDRRFWLDPDATSVRFYTPRSRRLVEIDDLVTLTSLQVDQGGDGVFEETWTVNTEVVPHPLNAASKARPWTYLETHPAGSRTFPLYPRSVRLTGRFGWPAIPEQIKNATLIQARRLLLRMREASFGVAALGPDGTAVRITQLDPDVKALLTRLVRRA